MLSQWFEPEPGGATIPSALGRSFARRGHHVDVLTGFPNYPTGAIHPGYRQRAVLREQLHPRLAVTRVPLYPSHDAGAARRVANYVSFAASARVRVKQTLGAVDAAWVYNSPATVPLVARSLERRRGVPFVLHNMDVWPDSVLDSGMAGRLSRVPGAVRGLHAMVRAGYDAAHTIAVISPGQVELLAQRGVPRNKIAYRPLWADEDVYRPRNPDRSLLPEGAREARLVWMYAGAFGHVQKLDDAIRAAALAESAGVHLVLVGQGIAETELRALVAQLGVSNVHFAGSRAPEVMGDLVAAADLHLVSLADTPLLRITMPSKVLSILASARPILGTCHGDAAREIENAGAGLALGGASVEEIGALLGELAQDPAVLEAWGLAGRRHYEQNLSIDTASEELEHMLSTAAGGARS